MTIEDKENQLFEEWAKKRKPFVRDGVVSKEHYRKSKHKIVFILKEVNKIKRHNWDLRNFVLRGSRRQTWNNVARWVHGIREIWESRETPKWEFYEDKDMKKFRKETLKSICAMNLKKNTWRKRHQTRGAEEVRQGRSGFHSKTIRFLRSRPDNLLRRGNGHFI